MSDSTSNSISLPQHPEDDRPLPEIIAESYGFPLAYHDRDSKRYYAVQDWIAGVAKPASHPGQFWKEMQKRLKRTGIELSTWCLKLPYHASNGRTYQMDHAEAESLYRITQRMDANTGLRDQILNYLARSGVVLDDMRRDPEKGIEMLADWYDEKEYRKLLDEGFTPEEARQWLEQRARGVQTRKWITGIWKERKARGRDFGVLTNRVSDIVHGKTATQRKLEMGLPKHDTPRNYDAAADQALTAVTEMMAGSLHDFRDSEGFDRTAGGCRGYTSDHGRSPSQCVRGILQKAPATARRRKARIGRLRPVYVTIGGVQQVRTPFFVVKGLPS